MNDETQGAIKKHIPQKRNLAPPPSHLQTRLVGLPGPRVLICVHNQKGFYITRFGNTPLWSHSQESVRLAPAHHPDIFRAAMTWQFRPQADKTLLPILTLADWDQIRFISVSSDLAKSPQTAGYDPFATPVRLVSISEAARASNAPQFAPLEIHLLDATMTRR